MLHFDALIDVENIVSKGETACNKQFLLCSQCFLSYMALHFHFKCTLKYPLQVVSIWTSLNFYCLVMGLTHSYTMTPFDAHGKQAF